MKFKQTYRTAAQKKSHYLFILIVVKHFKHFSGKNNLKYLKQLNNYEKCFFF